MSTHRGQGAVALIVAGYDSQEALELGEAATQALFIQLQAGLKAGWLL
jgi:hypothetical protein